jgi:uncharacterized protein YecE (DUF72 family)
MSIDMTIDRIRVGTAGWSIPRAAASRLDGEGSHLQRYARVLTCAEINTSFYREHSAATYARWATAVPVGFRFAVKVPQTITHQGGLRRSRPMLARFLAQTAGLGSKRGPLLVQLPPSLAFESRVARAFFRLMRSLHAGAIVCEPRHASWFTERAQEVLIDYCVGRVAADPARVPEAIVPGGWLGPGPLATSYYRWHGSPRKYWSSYSLDQIMKWATTLRQQPADRDCWCIFDNTASGSAIENTLELIAAVRSLPSRARHSDAPPDRRMYRVD